MQKGTGSSVAQMDQTVQETTAQTEELSSTARALAGQARQLETLVDRFKLDESGTTPTPDDGAIPAIRPPATRVGVAPRRRRGPERLLIGAPAA